MDDLEKFFVERRDWPRIAIEKLIDEVLIVAPDQGSEGESPAEVVNLSAGGAGLLTSIQIKKGMQVKLQIAGKDVPSLDLNAEVRWSAAAPVSTGKYPTGLKFVSLDSDGQAKLQNFIEVLKKHRPPSE